MVRNTIDQIIYIWICSNGVYTITARMGHEMGQIWNNDYLVTANLMLMESNERKEITRKRMEYACLKFHNKCYNIIIWESSCGWLNIKLFLSEEVIIGDSLVIESVTREDMGKYMCIARNDVQPASSKIFDLSVNCKHATLIILSCSYVNLILNIF